MTSAPSTSLSPTTTPPGPPGRIKIWQDRSICCESDSSQVVSPFSPVVCLFICLRPYPNSQHEIISTLAPVDSCDRYWDTEPCWGCWEPIAVFIKDCDSGGFFMQSCQSRYNTYQTFEYNHATSQVKHRSQCLGLSETSQVRLHPCNSNDPNQKWEYAENGDIKHVLSETCRKLPCSLARSCLASVNGTMLTSCL